MPNFKFVDFTCNLLKIDNYIESKQGSLVIYPTQNNANMAQSYSQYSWQFEEMLFLSIEDFTQLLLPTSKPILEDDKRVIALYQLLTDDEKSFFKVRDFFDFIKLANKIFTLFDELAVELLDFSRVIELLEEANSSLFPWQIDYYQRIQLLMLRYEAWLQEHNLSDKIFLKRADNIDLDYFAQYSQVYVINQFYYTALERAFIKQMEESGKEVTLVYQLPQGCVNKETFNAQAFSYADLESNLNHKPSLELIIDRNKFTMMNTLCKIITENEISQVVDRDFYETPYAKLLSRSKFEIKYGKSIVNSELYHFLEIVQQIIESIEYYNNCYFLPLHILIRAFLNRDFTSYFSISNSQNMLEELYNLRDTGILYCDMQGGMGREVISEALKGAIQTITAFVKRITEIRSIDALIGLFDSENGIVLARICSEHDLKFSNIRELVYTELANLKSFTYNNLISKWSLLSDKAEHVIIFKLFCDGLKAKTLKYTEKGSKKGVRVNSLLDTRNNSYESLIFLNMVEGVLPTTRSTQFLFNEKQREILTLKTYEEVRLREKYYFQRLVLSARKCYFLAIESIDEDISISSFLEELPLIKPAKDAKEADQGYGDLFKSNGLISHLQVDEEFWQVRLKSEDLSQNGSVMKLSYTKLSSLINNPLYYLIRDWARVQNREILTDPALDYRFVGVFAQDYVNHIITRIKDNFINQHVFYKFQFMSRDRLSEIYDSFIRLYAHKDYYIPHNYSFTFINSILKTALVEGMKYFFNIVMHFNLGLSEQKLDLIPEEGFSAGKKQKYKNFITEAENDYKLGIAVTGDADLRIENSENDSKVVIDFKTGKYSKEQLALYQYIYYWDEINIGNEVKAGIYQILKEDWVPQTKPAEATISKLKDKVIAILNEIALHGFSLPASAGKAEKYSKITRADLAVRR
ncbi:PD-(D/E)XK nuclease family protein [bacterium]|nr:PD-(D/E)XK nuclease family protein [bacterium]